LSANFNTEAKCTVFTLPESRVFKNNFITVQPTLATENTVKCDTVKNTRVENAGVENAGADSRGGKCRSRHAVWKAEPILYRVAQKVSHYQMVKKSY